MASRDVPKVAPETAVESPTTVAELETRRKWLVGRGRLGDAETLCRTWLSKEKASDRAEAHKCLANVFVARAKNGASGLMIAENGQRLAVGGLARPPRLSGRAATAAIDHLDEAAALHADDLSIHQGRLFLCFAAGEYGRAVSSLKASLAEHAGAEADVWLAYSSHFPTRRVEHAVAYATALTEAYPDSGKAQAQLGAWQAVAGDADAAKANLTAAAAALPEDAMAHWRLGEVLEAEGDRKGAATAYQRSLSLSGPFAEERAAAYERFSR